MAAPCVPSNWPASAQRSGPRVFRAENPDRGACRRRQGGFRRLGKTMRFPCPGDAAFRSIVTASIDGGEGSRASPAEVQVQQDEMEPTATAAADANRFTATPQLGLQRNAVQPGGTDPVQDTKRTW